MPNPITFNPFSNRQIDPSVATRLGTTELESERFELLYQLANVVQPVFFEVKTADGEELLGHPNSFKDVKLPFPGSVWRLVMLHVKMSNTLIGEISYLKLTRPNVPFYWRTFDAPANTYQRQMYWGRHTITVSENEVLYPDPGPGILFPSLANQEFDVRFKLVGNMLARAVELYALFASERIPVKNDYQMSQWLTA